MKVVAAVLLLTLAGGTALAQAREGMLSEREVEKLRDTADTPAERLKTYQEFLEDRDKELQKALAGRPGAEYAADLHDILEQMGSIADELNDNLDDWGKRHRDIRKPLPKLREATERWMTAVKAPANDARYDIVRRQALDAIQDMQGIVDGLVTEQAAYFKEHPEAAAAEKRRREDPHAPE